MPHRRSLAALLFAPATGLAAPLSARLIMLELAQCPFCRRWHQEVGVRAWDASDLGQRAPLLAVDVARGLPTELGWISEWREVPTFLLAVETREVGRIRGYNGATFFWQHAEALLRRL